MDLNQQARWQHLAIFAAIVVLLADITITIIVVNDGSKFRLLAATIGAIVFATSLALGTFATMSLRRAIGKAIFGELLHCGLFALPSSAAYPVVRLNAQLASHFGIAPSSTPRPPMPSVFGALVTATLERVQTSATLRPEQYEAALAALAATLSPVRGKAPAVISFATNPIRAMPEGKLRFQTWEQLRAAAPTVPEAELNGWVENIAIYGFLAALIVIAVPIARRLDDNPSTHIEMSADNRIVGRALGMLIFGSVIAVLMIPVYAIGKRYAARLPAEINHLGALARHFSTDKDSTNLWTESQVEAHVRDLVAAELGIAPSSLDTQTMLLPSVECPSVH